MSQHEHSKRWATDQISFWVTQRRLGQLKKIAEGLPPGASPIQAIDRALDLATTPIFIPAEGAPVATGTPPNNDNLSQIEARFSAISERMERNFAAGLAEVVSTVDRLSARVASLQSIMGDAADDDFSDISGDEMHDPTREIGDWLRVRLAALGLSETKLAVVRIAFHSESRQGDGETAFDFDAKIGAVDHGDVVDFLGTSRLRIGRIAATSPLFKLRLARSACLAARRISPTRWRVEAHLADEQGKLQPALGHFNVD